MFSLFIMFFVIGINNKVNAGYHDHNVFSIYTWTPVGELGGNVEYNGADYNFYHGGNLWYHGSSYALNTFIDELELMYSVGYYLFISFDLKGGSYFGGSAFPEPLLNLSYATIFISDIDTYYWKFYNDKDSLIYEWSGKYIDNPVVYVSKDLNGAFMEQKGYDNGYKDGNAIGYDKGYQFGERDGFENGYIDGFENGELSGIDIGYKNGYDDGFDVGVIKGRNEEVPDFLGIMIGGVFTFISVIGNWELLPGLKLIYIVGVTVMFGVVLFITGKRK